MIITRTSMISGKTHSLDLDVTEAQMNYYKSGQGYLHITFKNLSADEREFIKTGITKEEWDEVFDAAED